jgi:hypothetical protein
MVAVIRDSFQVLRLAGLGTGAELMIVSCDAVDYISYPSTEPHPNIERMRSKAHR